ncbi:growth hormone secretagogue receptor type 1 isoform X1 [Nasonia vitripennis]|uniref:G-protein coupled receptors family 1 profile domain-containing protein n=1 Tax=Nasonia vitripennis TaxID=7425 RepID=A0A7M7LMJ7_NASVI|nr:growth hormone secretagogue receptor type 1 isoform X1 [Nasonia vitripennis]
MTIFNDTTYYEGDEVTIFASTLVTNTPKPVNDFYQLPIYMQVLSVLICVIVMVIGIIGNLMVLIVILGAKDMRNSTNIFLVNLSIADLCLLLVCTPAILVEVNAGPEVWVLGEHMCKAIPFIESTIAHASVLTILAISFERYYAICKPLQANYVCTKSRATMICILDWIIAGFCTSPFLLMVTYKLEVDARGTLVPICATEALAQWSIVYIATTIGAFFVVPVIVLAMLYSVIVYRLVKRSAIKHEMNRHALHNRNQVIRMLCTVISAFFICLLPFRAMMIWVIVSPLEELANFGAEGYYCLLYFSRIMFYLNSALNPIFYALMSTKFKNGFLKILKAAFS